MPILGTYHFGKELRDAFKLQGSLNDVLFRRNYSERLVFSFAHQIQSEYYSGNIFASIEGISLEHFSASHHPSPLLVSYHVSRQAVFRFSSNYIKQDATTTSKHRKCII